MTKLLNTLPWNLVTKNLNGHHMLRTAMVPGQPVEEVQEHIDAMRAFVETTGGTPIQITSHPVKFGSGDWTCVVGEFEGGGRMVTVAKWRDGAITEEYIWM